MFKSLCILKVYGELNTGEVDETVVYDDETRVYKNQVYGG